MSGMPPRRAQRTAGNLIDRHAAGYLEGLALGRGVAFTAPSALRLGGLADALVLVHLGRHVFKAGGCLSVAEFSSHRWTYLIILSNVDQIPKIDSVAYML